MALNTTPFVAGSILTSAQMTNLPMGVCGTATLAANKTFTAKTDAGLSITWNAVSSRRYKLSFTGQFAGAGGQIIAVISDSSNVEVVERSLAHTSGDQLFHTLFGLISGVSGSVTYKVRLESSSGTGTMYGSNTRVGLAPFFVVEDIGPV